MKAKLLVVHGKLENRLGASRGSEVRIRRPRFLIGSGSDCHLLAQGRLVGEHHCELLLKEGQLHVRDLGSPSGTYVNDQRIGELTLLAAGDLLRVGRLQFLVEFETPASPPAPENDLMSDFVSELLVEADQEDQARRMEDPRMRQFRVEAPAEPATPTVPEPAEAHQRPPKRPPVKLPPPPKYVAENSVEAAQETLKKIFERPKRRE